MPKTSTAKSPLSPFTQRKVGEVYGAHLLRPADGARDRVHSPRHSNCRDLSVQSRTPIIQKFSIAEQTCQA